MVVKQTKNTYRRRRFAVVIVAALAVVAGVAYEAHATRQHNIQNQQNNTLSVSSDSSSYTLATEALGKLAVKERVSREGYSRQQFSPGWGKVDGCDMRNIILQRDLENVIVDSDNGCAVLSGTLQQDPYTIKTISFTRGKDTSNDVQIDHVVAVSDAWQKGAQQLSQEERYAFYNDSLNLIAVDGPANMAKGDADASDWLPDKPFRCRYIARQIAVKTKYYLWVTQSELSAMKRVLYTCPSQVLPVEIKH